MSTDNATVSLLGKNHHVVLPDFATREELIVAYGESAKKGGVALLRVYAAVLGACTRIGREADADLAACRYDILTFGGKVYSYLREQGVSPKDIADQALPVVILIGNSTFPRQNAVEETEGN